VVERYLLILLAKARSSKGGALLIVFGVLILFAFLIFGLASIAGDVAFMVTGVGPVIDFLGTGLGVLIGLLVAVILILLGVAFLVHATPQTESVEKLESISAQSAPAVTDSSQLQELERLRTKLDRVERERESLEKELEEAQPTEGQIGKLTGAGEDPQVVIQRLTAENKRLKETQKALREENQWLHAERDASGNQTGDEELKRRCCELSPEIFEFYRYQRQNMEDQLQSESMGRLYNDPAREQKRAELIEGHNRWIVDQYCEKFGGRTLKLSDDLAKHNCITPEDREKFKNPKKPEDIQYIAQRLDAICGRSGEV